MKDRAKLKTALTVLTVMSWIASTSFAIEGKIQGEARSPENGSSTEMFPMNSEFRGSNFNFDLESGSILNMPELNGHSWQLNLYIPRPAMGSYTALLESVTLPKSGASCRSVKLNRKGIQRSSVFLW